MKIKMDCNPAKDGSNPANAHIRLYPETNQEMANLLWIYDVFSKKCRFSHNSGLGDQTMFSVSFEEYKER